MRRLQIGLLALALAGCNQALDTGSFDAAAPADLAASPADATAAILSFGFDPAQGIQLPLPSDSDPAATAQGIRRDADGALALSVAAQSGAATVWVANATDWNRGTLSRVDAATLRETARYFTVTCGSLATGSTANCDGSSGCCAADSYPQLSLRQNNMPQGLSQQINLLGNAPSRTAVDGNGDVWIANRATGTQASVTKIAGDRARCKDRNKNGRIDTSNDANGDGLIETDCNGNGVPDDLADVKASTCTNGLGQEFFGIDDECVLFTTNLDQSAKTAEALALVPGANAGASDAWVGIYDDGKLFHLDGATGRTLEATQVPCFVNGLVVDGEGYGWTPPGGVGQLCFFDTRRPSRVGIVRNPTTPLSFGAHGVALDPDQSLWFAGDSADAAFRYTPDRSNGVATLGNGLWTTVNNPGRDLLEGVVPTVLGIAVDRRSPQAWFAFVATNTGWLIEIPGSTIALPAGMDAATDGATYPAVPVAGVPTAVGVDRAQNVWTVSAMGERNLTRVRVDATGAMTKPLLYGLPIMNDRNPWGDNVALADTMASTPAPEDYTDFTGWSVSLAGLHGNYSYVVPGCAAPSRTKWLTLAWTADQPPGSRVLADGASQSPLALDAIADTLSVDFALETTDPKAIPRLTSFTVTYQCLPPQ